jgi:hypothetical protein
MCRAILPRPVPLVFEGLSRRNFSQSNILIKFVYLVCILTPTITSWLNDFQLSSGLIPSYLETHVPIKMKQFIMFLVVSCRNFFCTLSLLAFRCNQNVNDDHFYAGMGSQLWEIIIVQYLLEMICDHL